MNLHDWNEHQIEEALGPTNRWYYGVHYKTNGNNASKDELILFYIEHGGARHYREVHHDEEPEGSDNE